MPRFSTNKVASKGTCFLDVSAEEAKNLLMAQGKEGSFIIRPSQSNAGSQSLTVRHNASVVHVKIQNTGEVYDLYGGEQFATLMELVEFYKDGEKLQLENGEFIRFSHPLFSSSIGQRCERWYHGDISSNEAEKRLRKQAIGSFLVRQSQTQPGSFVLSVLSSETDVTEVVIKKQGSKYAIGDGAEFNDLSKMIDHYRKHEITAVVRKAQQKLILEKSVNIGSIMASDFPSRTGELLKRFPGEEKDRDGFWEEFEQITNEEIRSEIYTKPRINGKKDENIKKNRFKNVLPYDETRVVLKDKDEPNYINANYIDTSDLDGIGLNRRYIATQGCLKNTAVDFWRMIWQEKVSIIVMTTTTVEMGKNKCFQYWPEEQGSSLTFELKNGEITVTFSSTEYSGDFITRVLTVTRKCNKKGDGEMKEEVGTIQIHHFQFPDWPDKMAPKDKHTESILKFVNAINEMQESITDTAPLVVHCSAGIGRTGSFILIDIITNQIKKEGLGCRIDVPKTLIRLREMRSGLVQTDAQYKFVYLAVREYIENLTKGKTPQVNEALYANQNDVGSSNRSQPPAYVKQKPPVPSVKPLYENLGTVAKKKKVPTATLR